MGSKVILAIVDGLNYQVACDCMGYLNGLVETGRGMRKKLCCETPRLSRPLYETILTGVHPVNSGIVHNDVVRLSKESSVFSLANQHGLKTAAAAYHWISELYNKVPFDPVKDRFTHDDSLPIQHGSYYWANHYPDDHLYAEAEGLRHQYDPDFMLLLSMNVDDSGHKQGIDSRLYRDAARNVDYLLSNYLPGWLTAGYQVIVTSDHGMKKDCTHGGTTPPEREIPFFAMGEAFEECSIAEIRQLEICGLICDLLGIEEHGKLSAFSDLCSPQDQ